MKIIKKRKLNRFHPYRKIIKKQKKYRNTLKTQLYPFQELCLDWKKFKKNQVDKKAIIVPSPTGTGKTLIAFVFCQEYKWNSLWICPNNVIDHHKNELLKHFYPSKKSIKIIGFSEFARLNLHDSIFKHKYTTLVLDEIHLIKKNTKVSELLLFLKYDFAIGLSASVIDCGFQFQDLHPFRNILKEDIYTNNSTRFKKIDIQTIKLQLNQNELKLYQMQIESLKELKSVNAKLNHIREWLSNQRIDIVMNFIETIKKKSSKIVFFSDFNSLLLNLSLGLEQGTFVRIDSSISLKKRDAALKRFETNSKLKYLLYSRKLGGVGIDIGFVSVLVLLEPAYNQDQTDQLTGRIQRLGQNPNQEQFIYEFQYENSCEGKIAQSKIVDENLVNELLQKQ